MDVKKSTTITLVCPSMTVRGTLVEGHLFLGGKGLSQFHKTTICVGKRTWCPLILYKPKHCCELASPQKVLNELIFLIMKCPSYFSRSKDQPGSSALQRTLAKEYLIIRVSTYIIFSARIQKMFFFH